MSDFYNTQDTGLFPSTKISTGIVLQVQHRGKYFFYPSRFLHNEQKYAKYEIMISYYVIFGMFYHFFNKNGIPML